MSFLARICGLILFMQNDIDIVLPSLRVCRSNSMNLLSQLVRLCNEPCEVVIFTYSITDGWMRQLQKLRQEHGIIKVVMLFDRDVMIRHREKLNQLQFVADEVYLSDSHAKLYFVKSENFQAIAVTSANATNNYRNECYYATDRRDEIETIAADISGILSEAYRII